MHYPSGYETRATWGNQFAYRAHLGNLSTAAKLIQCRLRILLPTVHWAKLSRLPLLVASRMILLLSLAMLFSRRSRFVGTTLVAPFRWTALSVLAVGVVELLTGWSSWNTSSISAWQYAAATSTFCPLVAVLGAKRPQNIGWQFIVASLWGVLVLPVAEMLVLWRGGDLDEGPARRWFVLILLGVGLSNYMLTRFGFAALLATVGQALLLLPRLPFSLPVPSWHFTGGSICLAIAIAVAWLQTRVPPRGGGWDLVWRDFRNAFGIVWGLRVMERLNTTAKVAAWQSELTWYGFTDVDQKAELELRERDRAVRTLLRRFVSNEWIDRRLENGQH